LHSLQYCEDKTEHKSCSIYLHKIIGLWQGWANNAP